MSKLLPVSNPLRSVERSGLLRPCDAKSVRRYKRRKHLRPLSAAASSTAQTEQAPAEGSLPARESGPAHESLDLVLPELAGEEASESCPVDLVVAGAGPGGLGVADQASARGLRVVVVDPAPLAFWPNNYGVWVDEFRELGHDDCFAKTWSKARVALDEDPSKDLVLPREYAQVDRRKLKTKLLNRCVEQGVKFVSGKVDSTEHFAGRPSKVAVQGGRQLYASSVLDATGHARRLVQFDQDFTPGYQAAFGILAEVESHPFPLDEMLFMDWRDDHLAPAAQQRNRTEPTFLYAMPFSPTLVFLEETSLVERPYVGFDDLKERLTQRLAARGVVVRRVVEEEYCLIPMGGVLPSIPQPVLGIGGTAGMVHPSTGFMVSKTLQSAGPLVDSLVAALGRGLSGDTDAIAAEVWSQIWTDAEKRTRTFYCFGMETLMQLDVAGVRKFFGAFFTLPQEVWAGFLSWRIEPPGLIALGLALLRAFPNSMKVEFIWKALPFMPSFVPSFLLGNNAFTSDPWEPRSIFSFLGEAKRREALQEAEQESAAERPRIPPPNPAASPITSSSLDFTSLLGGMDADTPAPPSQLRDDREWKKFQERKVFQDQTPTVEVLDALPPDAEVDVVVVGAGPAGLSLAAELGARGLSVGLVAPDTPFVNNYGVWHDEFQALGLEDTLLNVYGDVLYWMDDSDPAEGLTLGRRYGRVGRKELRDALLARCRAAGVRYLPDLVDGVQSSAEASTVTCLGGAELRSRTVCLATGHNRELVQYEDDATPFGWQTAFGVEVRMKGHPFPLDRAVFMDFRQSDQEPQDADGMWRVPSFLYVLPADEDTVFLEETCLASRVQVPFDELKRRLYRRLASMGLSVAPEDIIEEEASWIPLGGPLPKAPQRVVAFGAAAGLVHPASGYSIVNSLRRTQQVAEAIAQGLARGSPTAASAAAWEVLWSQERRRQMSFNQFGLELILSLRIEQLRGFFTAFYALPPRLSQGFLSNDLSSGMLLLFALTTFAKGDNQLRFLLIAHLLSPSQSGVRLINTYASTLLPGAARGAETLEEQQTVQRRAPPQQRPTSQAADEQLLNEGVGLVSGFLGRDWWEVGVGPAGREGAAAEQQAGWVRWIPQDRERSGGQVAGSFAGSMMWSVGVERGGASQGLDELYGSSRRKFLPNFILDNMPQDLVPAYLTGTMPGDYGFDPLQMGAGRDLQKAAESELLHGRWAMLAAVGVLLPDLLSLSGMFGNVGYHWWNVGLQGGVLQYQGYAVPAWLVGVALLHFPLLGLAELFRVGKITPPGAQFQEMDRMYPGGSFFDPMGLSVQPPEDLEVLKVVEVTYGRLAMVANFVFYVEAFMFQKGPIEVLFSNFLH